MKPIQRIVCILSIGLVAMAGHATWAAVKPSALFSDGALLQQGMPVPIWGSASDGEKVTVTIQGQTASTTARAGRWLVRLKPLQAGGPFTLTIAGDNTVELKNILVGEVYVCSGQSNMEFPLQAAANGQEALAQSEDAMLRLFTVPHTVSAAPVHELTGDWKPCGPETAGSFSAVAYFFGRDLRRALHVPVGLIHTSWGGTPAEAWTSRATLEGSPALQSILTRHDRAVEQYISALSAFREARDGDLKGFTIAGDDRKFVDAHAVIQGSRVIVSSPAVPHPVAVRYGWANYPVVNLYNEAGLPASPFRTDDFPLTTAPHSAQAATRKENSARS